MTKFLKLTLSLAVIASAYGLIQDRSANSDDLYEMAQSYLNDFFEDPTAAIDENPIRDYTMAPDLYDEDIALFRDMVEEHRSARIADPSLAERTPRDIVIERGERDIEENTRRAFYDNDDPSLILGNNYVNQNGLLPRSGSAVTADNRPLGWSNDYWPLTYGSLSMRYSHARDYRNFAEAFNLYRQPHEYEQLLRRVTTVQITADETDGWSPAEKYDLLVGDETFSLTNFLKREPINYAEGVELAHDADGNVLRVTRFREDVAMWMGKCHGWAAAATVVPRVVRDITVTTARDNEVHFHPDDIRGLVTLKWAESPYRTLFVGGRCNQSLRDIDIDSETGAIRDQTCFDVNPGTFKIVLANQVGLRQKGIVMDATFDSEVWNHPIRSYETIGYFNITTGRMIEVGPNQPIPATAFSPYGAEGDKFLNLREEKWADAHEHAARWRDYRRQTGGEFRPSRIVGEVVAVDYLVETRPTHGQSYEDQIVRVVYKYDLELDERGEIVGGEWYQNKHPDFLWAVADGATPLNNSDRYIASGRNGVRPYDGSPESLDVLNEHRYQDQTLVQLSSEENGAPLATVLDWLVSQTRE